jgi:hypothetical protein
VRGMWCVAFAERLERKEVVIGWLGAKRDRSSAERKVV